MCQYGEIYQSKKTIGYFGSLIGDLGLEEGLLTDILNQIPQSKIQNESAG